MTTTPTDPHAAQPEQAQPEQAQPEQPQPQPAQPEPAPSATGEPPASGAPRPHPSRRPSLAAAVAGGHRTDAGHRTEAGNGNGSGKGHGNGSQARTRPASASPRPTDWTRPLSARSVVASTLLGVDPPELPTSTLVRAGEVFGIAEGTTRVALSRMVTAGELEAGQGTYRLTGHLVERQAALLEGRRPPTGPWDGRWECYVVRPDTRSAVARAELRRAMRALRVAELREGVWLRPANLDPERQPDARQVVLDQCRRFVVIPDPPPGEVHRPTGLAAELWDLDGWATEARRLQACLVTTGEQLGAEAGHRVASELLREGWMLGATVLRHLAADPLLPEALVPEDWPGPDLRAEVVAYDVTFGQAWVAAIDT